MTPAQVISAFELGVRQRQLQTQKDIFDWYNNLGCPLD